MLRTLASRLAPVALNATTITTAPLTARFSSLVLDKTPALPTTDAVFVPNRGMKHVARPHLRCKDCYFEIKDEVLYVNCTTHPRHKQAERRTAAKNNWIMTHATQGGYNHGNGKGRQQMWTQNAFRADF